MWILLPFGHFTTKSHSRSRGQNRLVSREQYVLTICAGGGCPSLRIDSLSDTFAVPGKGAALSSSSPSRKPDVARSPHANVTIQNYSGHCSPLSIVWRGAGGEVCSCQSDPVTNRTLSIPLTLERMCDIIAVCLDDLMPLYTVCHQPASFRRPRSAVDRF
jgi:hypothetical protein